MSRRLVAAVATVAVGAGVAAIVAIGANHDETATAGIGAESLSTVTIIQQDVITYEETTATLGFTESATVASPVTGTVTTILAEGAVVEAGTVVATVDGAPVVALIGDVPAWRDLSTSASDGVDVRQLEANLVTLGFDPDGEIVVDEEFDEATEDAVTSWEDSLGLEGDDGVPVQQVVFVPGDLLVDTVDVTVGGAASAGSPLLTARVTERRFLLSTGGASVVSSFADPGTEVSTGTILFANDGLPVAAIEGDPAAVPTLGRDLEDGVADGSDVRLLEQMLAAGGFDADGWMIVDDHFDVGTSTAVRAWWQSFDPAIELAVDDIVVPIGSFVVVPDGLEVADAIVAGGTMLVGDTVVMTLSSPARVVSTTAPIDDDTFALGASIDVEFPDGTIEPGTVVAVGNVATTSAAPGDTPTVAIDIHVGQIPPSVDSFVSIPVTLRVVDDSVPDAYVAPVSALVALAEGGYALEVVSGQDATGAPTTRLIGVETGLFADGFVVVTGPDVAAGLEVVVPS
ncbi:MAG: peptidoglycan-binding protein [Acidimicrobiia bacterium]